MSNQRRSFPELVGQNAQQAAAYIIAQGNFIYINHSVTLYIFFYNIMLGLRPEILRDGDPMTREIRMDRVRIIVDPTRTVVIRAPIVG